MGNWRTMLGDCLVRMPEIPDASVDLILADLPYGTTACKWDSVIPLKPLWEQYKRVIKPHGAIVLTASQPFTSFLVVSNPKWFQCEWIWKKNAGSNFALVKFMPMKEHESLLVFSNKTPNYHPILQRRSREHKPAVWAGSNTRTGGTSPIIKKGVNLKDGKFRVPSSVQFFNRERGLHPTQKPVALMDYFIRTYSRKGDTVLDNTMGSGTTVVAALLAGRKAIGIEKDRDIYKGAVQRIKGTMLTGLFR